MNGQKDPKINLRIHEYAERTTMLKSPLDRPGPGVQRLTVTSVQGPSPASITLSMSAPAGG